MLRAQNLEVLPLLSLANYFPTTYKVRDYFKKQPNSFLIFLGEDDGI
jgi:hypothetical protein